MIQATSQWWSIARAGAFLRCIASDPRRAHGHAPSLISARRARTVAALHVGRKCNAALSTSLGKLPGARLIVLGTQPAADAIGATWFARLLRGEQAGCYSQIHAAEKDANPWAVKAWKQANPSLGNHAGFAARDRNRSGECAAGSDA